MPVFPYILASEDYAKLIGAAVFVVIWIVGAISGAVKKSNERIKSSVPARPLPPIPPPLLKPSPASQQSKARAAAQQVQTVRPPRTPGPRVIPGVTPPPMPGARGRPPMPVASDLQMPKPVPTSAPRPPSPKPNVAVTPQAPASPITNPLVRRQNGVNAAALRRWLRPSILRQQFMLTELLQPPLALRERQMNSEEARQASIPSGTPSPNSIFLLLR